MIQRTKALGVRVVPLAFVALLLGLGGGKQFATSVRLGSGEVVSVAHRVQRETGCNLGHGVGCGGGLEGYGLRIQRWGATLSWEHDGRCTPIVVNECRAEMYIVCHKPPVGIEETHEFLFFSATERSNQFRPIDPRDFPRELASQNVGAGFDSLALGPFEYGRTLDAGDDTFGHSSTGLLWAFLQGRMVSDGDPNSVTQLSAFQKRHFSGPSTCGGVITSRARGPQVAPDAGVQAPAEQVQ